MFAAAYGANHFVPLLQLYRQTLGLSDQVATSVFGVYAMGLVPGLLLGGPASDRYGRRPVMLTATALTVVATAVLFTGQWDPFGLYAGRLSTGVTAGCVFTCGTAWVKELSRGEPPGTGARRAAIALTAGFGTGPLLAAPLAQWRPASELLPYAVHAALAAASLALLARAPETLPVDPTRRRPPLRLRRPASATSARFTRVVAPAAPCVFGSVTLVFSTLPAHGAGPVGGLDVAFSGVLAVIALGAGLVVQPVARRLGDPARGRGTVEVAVLGLASVSAGCLASAAATARPGAPAVILAALLLGGGYGMCLVSGLREVERLAPPDELAGLLAIYYVLCYAGLGSPYLLSLVATSVGYPLGLSLGAVFALLVLALVVVQGRLCPAPGQA